MTPLLGLLILVALPFGLMLNGYWLAALLADRSAVERLAMALACGLSLVLALIAGINFFYPLSGLAALACVSPALLTILLPGSRLSLSRDLTAAWAAGPRSLVLALAVVFFAALLWPVIRKPSAFYYDGTSNHDSFFWITSAEHLKQHTYLEYPERSATKPWLQDVPAIIGLQPQWGRMGAEGLIALASSLTGISPIKIYLYGTASLAVTWVAVIYLAFLTFVSATIHRFTAAALVCLQPIFIFFYANNNLPNLIGILTGGSAVIAIARASASGWGRRNDFVAWSALGALSLHGLLCTYPEMLPFILLPCGLLWLRPWFVQPVRTYALTSLMLLLVPFAGAALNPATTLRACHGFMTSFEAARNNNDWANLFNPLIVAEYLPALATLSVPGAKSLGPWLGWPLSLLLVVTTVWIIRRSRDPFGLIATLSGGGALLGYTLITHFLYGWQKTVQFSGVFVALLFPVAAVEILLRLRGETTGRSRRLAAVAVAGVAFLLTEATVMNCRDLYKWSKLKVISLDWFALSEQSHTALRDAPVLIESASFLMPFFHGMWATYFLPGSNLYFGARGEESGGYLRSAVINEAQREIPPPKAVLVGRAWADTFDANSPRLLTGSEFALLRRSNRVLVMSGVFPLNGPPGLASGRIIFEIVPHSTSNLLLDLAPRRAGTWTGASWQVTRQVEGREDLTLTVSGPPWKFSLPLVAGQHNRVSVNFAGEAQPADEFPFFIKRLRIEASP